MANTQPQARAQDPDFNERHGEDLGIKRFAMVEGKNTLLPLATAGIAGMIGFFTLGKPLRMMFPRIFNTADHVPDILRGLKKIKPR